jgi:hypothetical protein
MMNENFYEMMNKILSDYGWDLDEIIKFSEDGGSSNQIDNISALQCLSELVKFYNEEFNIKN